MTNVANDRVLSETWAEARAIAQSWRFWAGLLGAGLVIGLGGPFGTYDTLPALPRIGYWFVVVLTSFWLAYLVSFCVATWTENQGLGYVPSIAVGAALASLPVTAWLASLHSVFFAASFWAESLALWPYVAVTSLIVSFVFEVLAAQGAGPTTHRSAGAEPEWLDKLPAELGRDLIFFQSQDHYLRVRTKRGETLIRGKLQDAAEELGNFGLRLHRSWWVAHAAIRKLEYRNGAPLVVLEDGMEVPVGRKYRRSALDTLR